MFQCFISLLSEATIKSKYCQDELALAYVSSKHIFPCGLAKPENLFPLMDTGMYVEKWWIVLESIELKSHIFAYQGFNPISFVK